MIYDITSGFGLSTNKSIVTNDIQFINNNLKFKYYSIQDNVTDLEDFSKRTEFYNIDDIKFKFGEKLASSKIKPYLMSKYGCIPYKTYINDMPNLKIAQSLKIGDARVASNVYFSHGTSSILKIYDNKIFTGASTDTKALGYTKINFNDSLFKLKEWLNDDSLNKLIDKLSFRDLTLYTLTCNIKDDFKLTTHDEYDGVFFKSYCSNTQVLLLTTSQVTSKSVILYADKYMNGISQNFNINKIKNSIVVPNKVYYDVIQSIKNILNKYNIILDVPCKTHEMVISRFKENIEWIKDFENVQVYDKNIECNVCSNIFKVNTSNTLFKNLQRRCSRCSNILKPLTSLQPKYLSNTGREAHTYLFHIISNWNNLAEYTIFSQGNVLDHLKDVNRFKTCYTSVYDLMVSNICCIKPSERDKYFTNDGHILHHGKWKTESIRRSRYTFKDWLHNIVKYDLKDDAPIHVTWHSIFAVNVALIKSKPIEYYVNLIQSLDDINPEEGHYFERAWFYIFNMSSINIKSF